MTLELEAARRRIRERELTLQAEERARTLANDHPPLYGGLFAASSPPSPARADEEVREAWTVLERNERWSDEMQARLDEHSGALAAGRGPATGPRVRARVSVIVPVHNAPGELRECLYSLMRNTTQAVRLLLVDDASTDGEIGSILSDAQQLTGVEVLRNRGNRGFAATVNRGIRAASGDDVVVLNSDTVVGPRWLERLTSTAHGDPLIATVTPLSDNAGAFSVPLIGVPNQVPHFLEYDDVSRVVAQQGQYLRPHTPTGNGFCMYIKRAVLDEIGSFDESAFPRGYGEENDFCMRALARGWHHVVDDGVFIRHAREASFGSNKGALMKAGRAVVDERHPQYTGLVREFVRSPDMQAVRTSVERAYREVENSYAHLASGGHEVRPRVLFVLHEGSGGAPATNLDLMRALEAEYDCWLLTSTGTELWVDRIVNGERVEAERHKLDSKLSPLDFSRRDYRDAVAGILDRHAVELIHVRHLFKHTFDLPTVAASRGIPMVFSFHDYYFTCPTVHLLDDQRIYCGGVCTEGLGNCTIPSPALAGLPPLKHRFVYEWREEVERMLADVDVFVTTSAHAREVHRTALPALERRPFELIEHGRDLAETSVAVPPAPGDPVRIAVPGNLDMHKGAGLMRAILEHDTSGRIAFYLMGDIAAEYADLGHDRGPYSRDDFAARLSEIRPAFVGIFSVWAETYSHILSEAWAAGVPVLATRLGAMQERIDRHGGGWLIDPDDPPGAVETILEIADDPRGYDRVLAAATARNLRTVAAMSGDYSALYRRVLDHRRTLVPVAARRRNRHFGHGVLRAEVIVPGSGGRYPDSTHVRLLRRLLHPSARRKLQVTLQHGEELEEIPGERELVIVQATSMPPERIDELITRVADRGLPLVLDLDTDPFASAEEESGAEGEPGPAARLVAAASLVMVSNPRLQRLLAERGAATAVVEDVIDERLFFVGEGGTPAPGPARGPGQPIQVLCLDPAEIPVLGAALAQREGDAEVPVELSVVGAPPDGHDSYPAFIRSLRAHRQRWDFALAPLADTPSHRATGDLRFLELSALGLPGAFSDLDPFATVQDGVQGLLVGDESTAWARAITTLAADVELRSALAAAALEYVCTRRLVRHGADALLAALFDVAQANR